MGFVIDESRKKQRAPLPACQASSINSTCAIRSSLPCSWAQKATSNRETLEIRNLSSVMILFIAFGAVGYRRIRVGLRSKETIPGTERILNPKRSTNHMHETRPSQPQPQTTAAQLSPKQTITDQQKIMILKLAILSCLGMRIAMPYLSTSQQPLTQTILLLRSSRLSSPGYLRYNLRVSRVSQYHRPLYDSCVMHLLCNTASTFAFFPVSSTVHLSLSILVLSFCLSALHFLAFSHLSSPLSFRQYIREPSVFIP